MFGRIQEANSSASSSRRKTVIAFNIFDSRLALTFEALRDASLKTIAGNNENCYVQGVEDYEAPIVPATLAGLLVNEEMETKQTCLETVKEEKELENGDHKLMLL